MVIHADIINGMDTSPRIGSAANVVKTAPIEAIVYLREVKILGGHKVRIKPPLPRGTGGPRFYRSSFRRDKLRRKCM
jgi:hypothetical protein